MLHHFFDKIYVLNQQSRLDRWIQFEREAKRIGLHNYEQIYTVSADQPYQSFCLSQRNLLGSFLNSGANTLLALEDDVVFKSHGWIENALNELPVDWDILYLGCNPHSWEPYSINLRRITGAWTTHAVAYSRKAVEKICKDYNPRPDEWTMYDEWLRAFFHPTGNVYCTFPFVAIQREGFSDLWGTRTSYGWSEMEQRIV